MRANEYDPFQDLHVPERPLIDPSPHFTRPDGPITLDALSKFFQDAFLPNHDDCVQPSNFGALTQLKQSSYVRLIHARHPDGPWERIRILDLASGDAPYLRHLFSIHNDHVCNDSICERFRRSVAKKVSYVCVNNGIPENYMKLMSGWITKFGNCFESVVFLDANLQEEECLVKLHELASQDPFDRIIMSNAWHELPAKKWAWLISRIPDLLKENGKFIILDLEHPMMLENHQSMAERIADGLSFWEADALYLSQSGADELIQAIGLERSHTSNFDDLAQPWWWVEGKKTSDKALSHELRLQNASKVIDQAISDQTSWWHTKSREERSHVTQVYSQTSDISARLYVALQYLCLAASQTIRNEYSEED